MKFKVLIYLLAFTNAFFLFAQYNTKPIEGHQFGIQFGANYNMHQADFRNLPGVPNCCPLFESGSGMGISAGLLYDWRLNGFLTLTGRIIYSDYSAELESDEGSSISIDGVATPAIINHYLSAKLSSISFDPIIGINPIGDLKLYLGGRVGFVIGKSFTQEERLKDPTDYGAFENGLRVRNPRDGDIPEASNIVLSGLSGISYDLPLNKDRTLILSPGIEYILGITPIVNDYTWSANSMCGYIAVKYSPSSKESEPEKIFEEIQNIDTIKIETKIIAENIIKTGIGTSRSDTSYSANSIIITDIFRRTDTLFIALPSVLEADVRAVGVDNNGEESAVATIKVEEFLSTKMISLLNYIFFDDNRYTIR